MPLSRDIWNDKPFISFPKLAEKREKSPALYVCLTLLKMQSAHQDQTRLNHPAVHANVTQKALFYVALDVACCFVKNSGPVLLSARCLSIVSSYWTRIPECLSHWKPVLIDKRPVHTYPPTPIHPYPFPLCILLTFVTWKLYQATANLHCRPAASWQLVTSFQL